MIKCPRCGREDDGSSYQCPGCFTVLQQDLVPARKKAPPADAMPPPSSWPPPPGAPGAQPLPGPTPDNPYHPPLAQPPPGYPPGYQRPRPMGVPDVPTYLAHSIAMTLLCCLPFGIVGIVYAAKVGTMQAAGQYEEAVEASDKARMWCWLSFGCGLVGIMLYIAVMATMGGTP